MREQYDQILEVAKANGWTVEVASPYSFWNFQLVRGREIVMIRTGKRGQLTVMEHFADGICFKPRRNKFRETCVVLSNKSK